MTTSPSSPPSRPVGIAFGARLSRTLEGRLIVLVQPVRVQPRHLRFQGIRSPLEGSQGESTDGRHIGKPPAHPSPSPPFPEPAPSVSWGTYESHRLSTVDGHRIAAWFGPGARKRQPRFLLNGNMMPQSATKIGTSRMTAMAMASLGRESTSINSPSRLMRSLAM